MPLQETSGNVTTDAYGGGVAAKPTYIEDVFSTYVYTGDGGTQSINTGIDLTTKTGLVWAKCRSGAYSHMFQDTVRGSYKYIQSDNTVGQNNNSLFDWFKSFNNNGFTVAYTPSYGTALNDPILNGNGQTYVAWTFVKQPKFFDVVTYTGTGSATTIAHSLGSTPGCIIVKRTDTTSNWQVYHNGLTSAAYSIQLNLTSAQASATTVWNSTAPTSTVFSVGTDATVNASGGTYVAYLFAHNAGGFGLTGTDNVISCGSYTGNSSTQSISLGYEPQLIMIKCTSTAGTPWVMLDTMRGWANSDSSGFDDARLMAQSSSAESLLNFGTPTATGFDLISAGDTNGSGRTYIYIAIRRGPMKVPTSGTSVFSPNAYAGTSSAQTQTTNFPVDLFINKTRNAASDNFAMDRLRGSTQEVETNTTAAESALSNIGFDSNTGVKFLGSQLNGSGSDFILWSFRRAPSFFDEVCSTGDGVGTALNHNLTVVPELYIQKRRDIAGQNWFVWAPGGNQLKLNLTDAGTTPGFTIGTSTTFNPISYASGGTYVNYLFATCAGVSKVGTYTGNGSTQTINCGFTGGARFVLIKRTDSTGAWYVYDTARGMTTLTDPYLRFNSTAAETATLGSVTSVSTGFAVNASILAAINTNAASYIFLAIA